MKTPAECLSQREREICHLPGLNLGLSRVSLQSFVTDSLDWDVDQSGTGIWMGDAYRFLSCTDKTFQRAETATEGDSGHRLKSVAWKTWALSFFMELDAQPLLIFHR